MAKTFIAVVNTKTVAFLTILYYGKFAYFWVGGSLPEYLKLGVNNFLVFKVGEYLHNNGIAHVDFIGGDIKEIAEFKKSFGSRPVKHIQVEKSFSPKGKLYRMLMKMKAKLNE